MKIAVFTEMFYPKIDGIAVSIKNSITALARKGHRFVVFCPRYNMEREDKVIHKNITVNRIFSLPLLTYKEVRISIVSLRKVMKILKEFNPDIIHVNTPGVIGIIGIKAAKKLNIPLIGTYHGLISEEMIHVSPSHLLGINKIRHILGKHDDVTNFLKKTDDESLLKRIGWNFSLNVYNKCDIVSAPSEAIRKLLIRKKIKTKTVFISNGIDLGKFKPKSSYPRKKSITFIHVGRISFEKNIDIIIKAMARVIKKSNNIVLKIIGDGPALHVLKELTKKLNLNKYILFIGKIPHDEISSYYQKADVFITASPMETQGLVLLEAMACGLPVIGVDKFAIPELVKDGYDGYISAPYDEEDLSKTMLKMINNRSKFRYFGKNALKIAKEHDLHKVVNQVYETYNELIKNKN